jgi:predicted Zn-dependent protease
MYGRGFGMPVRRRGGGLSGRLLIGLLLALFALGAYFFGTQRVENPVTGEVQRVSLTVQEEIMMGLQAAPEMANMHGGLHPDQNAQALVDDVGQEIVRRSAAGDTDYQFEFHLLRDPETINAFALPGGQIFITAALYGRLETEGQLAGVLAHEVGHVVGRHAAERIAKTQLVQGLTGAAVIAAYDPNNPGSAQQAYMAQLVGQLVTMKYSRSDELESDQLSVRFMADAGYDPRSMLAVMAILDQASQGQRPPEFLSTHPDPGNREQRIQEAIAAEFPDGVPDGLIE